MRWYEYDLIRTKEGLRVIEKYDGDVCCTTDIKSGESYILGGYFELIFIGGDFDREEFVETLSIDDDGSLWWGSVGSFDRDETNCCVFDRKINCSFFFLHVENEEENEEKEKEMNCDGDYEEAREEL